MMPPPAPVDVALLLLWAAVVWLSAQRGALGLIVGGLGLLLLRPFLLLAEQRAALALPLALAVGVLIGVGVRRFPALSLRQPRWGHLLGALGGALLGGALVLALLVSLPLGRDLSGALRYPDPELPLAEALQGSRFVELGRAILLYPLLEPRGQIAAEQRGLIGALHRFFVVGEPWREE